MQLGLAVPALAHPGVLNNCQEPHHLYSPGIELHPCYIPSLVTSLHGAYVALLHPHSFGRVVGDALNEVLRQFSGLDTQAQHVEVSG